jgi:hypothetical protein
MQTYVKDGVKVIKRIIGLKLTVLKPEHQFVGGR